MKASLVSGALIIAGAVFVSQAASAANMLTAQNGMTVYVFDKDTTGVSACYDDCAKHWPPYLAKGGEKIAKGWAKEKRNDGSMQWTFDKKPLYFYAGDNKAGDMAGDHVGNVWHVVYK